MESKRMTFYLCKNVDSRRLRYYLHKLENLKELDPEMFKKVIESKKECRRTITLTEEEIKICEKYGRATNLYLNYVIMVSEDGERV
ncbi:DUF2540 domain-containing protein [Methanotorris igneus]|uniref:Uncharacterized protein n=1 Tax=Methanotorris igneus (strain DSM 5666 / JCM 11834 / Kol 5) TaxID=880724 RepID=F6BBZ8_METIK|nr:DUF2540 domain-containing protein [Methanotorris igneus]AEF96079.1 hypothetical protein Metig_0524 [Methanotorris igneus Kol 5]